MTRVLVVGGAGYVGSVTVEALVAAGHAVMVLDDLSTGHRAAVVDGARLVTGRYEETAAVQELLEREGIEAVLHCAARALVGESVEDPALYFRENVGGGIGLLEAVRLAGVRRFVFSSSCAVYGVPDATPIREDHPLRPVNPYGETKRAFESALGWYTRYGIRSVILRYFNVAGASERNGEQHRPETHLIPNVIAACEDGGPPLTVFGDDYPTPDGTAIRDYIHVADLAEAHLLAIEATSPGDPRTESGDGAAGSLVCNLGNGIGFSVREIIAEVERIARRPVPFRVGPRRAGDPPVLVGSAERAATELGWRPRRPNLAEMIQSALAWRAGHPGGYAD